MSARAERLLRLVHSAESGRSTPSLRASDDAQAIPDHEWNGSRLRFERAPGEWGDWTDLRGPSGPRGPRGPKGEPGDGGSGGIDVTALPTIPAPTVDDFIILERGGEAFRVSVEALRTLFAGEWSAPAVMNGGHADSEQTLAFDGGRLNDEQDLNINGGAA